MAAAPDDAHLDRVARCHQRTRAKAEGADRHTGMIVQPDDRLARKALEQAIGGHALRAAVGAGFLGGLEDQMHGAVEVARVRELLRRAEQNGGVAVVTACVHLPAWMLA